MSYDPIKDLAPVTLVGSIPMVLVVNKAVPAQTRRRTDRARQVEAGRTRLCDAGARHLHPSRHRAVQAADRHRDPARAVSGQSARHERRDRRADSDVLRFRDDRRAASARRQGARACDHRVEALACAARTADHDRGRVPDFDVSTWIAIYAAGRHAARHHRPVAWRDRSGVGAAGREGAADRARLRHRRRRPRQACGADEVRYRPMGRGDREGRDREIE